MSRPTLIEKVDKFQRERPWLAIPVATAKQFDKDGGSDLAVVVAFYAFFSVFPLLLVFVTVLGYVLSGDQTALDSVKSSVLGQFPVIGNTIENATLKGSVLALILGIVLSLYSGLGITGAARRALDTLWEIPKHERHGFVEGKLRGLLLLTMLGGMFAIASGASGAVSGGLGAPLLKVVGIVISLVLNLALFMTSFRMLCSERIGWRVLLPGAVVASVLWEVLQVLGGVYIDHIKHSADVYGTFALVLGILAWLHIGSQMTLYCAELNVVLEKKRWPQPLLARISSEATE